MSQLENRNLIYAVAVIGVSSIVTQIVLTRELLVIIDGNELVVGFFLFAWFLLTGAGAYIGKLGRTAGPNGAAGYLVVALASLGLIPFVQIFGIRALRLFAAVPGSLIDVGQLVIWVPILIAPYALLSGHVLTYATRIFIRCGQDTFKAGEIYVADSIGDILGGILFSFVLAFFAGNIGSLLVPAVLNLSVAWFTCKEYGFKNAPMILLLLAVIAGYVVFGPLERFSLGWMYPAQKIEQAIESRYGRIVITSQNEQRTVFENGMVIGSTGATSDAEELVHASLAQVNNSAPMRVLLIAGGIGGSLSEILKYSIAHVDYVELDPAIVAVTAKLVPAMHDSRVRVHTADGRKFIERASRGFYDAILIDLPPPSSLQINRFYSKEFFRAAHQALMPGGIVAMALPGFGNYLTDELGSLFRDIATSGKTAFAHALALPLGQTIMLFSDTVPDQNVGSVLIKTGIETRYVNVPFLRGILTADRLTELDILLSVHGKVNRDLYPAALRSQLRYWLRPFGLDISPFFIVVGLAAILFLLFASPLESVLASSGFASMSVEIILLLLFQVSSGYMYYTYGLMVTIFLAGIPAGAWVAQRLTGFAGGRKWNLLVLELMLIILLLSVWTVCATESMWKSAAIQFAMLFATAFVTGAQFPIAAAHCRASGNVSPARLYAADFIGGAVGAILCTLVLLPVAGIRGALVMVALVKIISAVKLFMSRQSVAL